MLRLYDYADSGNGYKIRLLAALLDLPLEVVPVDILARETRSDWFTEINPNQKVPVLALDSGEYLAESNAILCHLAEGTALLPAPGLARSRVLSWLFFEQYSHEPYLATARFILRHTPPDSVRRAELAHKKSEARRALGVLETALSAREYLTSEGLSIADLALFAYTHRSDEAEVPLDEFPSIRAWIQRITAHPRFVPMLV